MCERQTNSIPSLRAILIERPMVFLVCDAQQGAGNTVFPLLSKNENPSLVVHACDYAKSAVDVVKVSMLSLEQASQTIH
jgi:hypothetical protein